MKPDTLADGIGWPSVGSGSCAEARELSARAGLALGDRDEDRPPEEAPRVARDAARVRARMRANGLASDPREVRVVVVPAPGAVGKADEVLVHPRAPEP